MKKDLNTLTSLSFEGNKISLSIFLLIGFVFTCSSFYKANPLNPAMEMVEICDNGIDDDADGFIDLNDSDCECPVIEPKSLIPNPSFEDRNCCPDNRAQLDCAVGWIQASAPTTDFIHSCGWMGPNEYFPPMPFPDGDGVMGFRDGRVGRDEQDANRNWKEYAGACLINPLEKNTSYRFEFELGLLDFQKSPSLFVTFFGTTDCKYLPFGGGDDTFGCPTNGPNWVRLGAQRFSGGGNRWVKGAIDITPDEDIYAIAIGPDCREVTSMVNIYYYFDNLILADAQSFAFKITEVNHPCAEDFTLEVPLDEDLDYQWYKDGVALIQETEPQLSKMYGEGDYQVRTLGKQTCKVTQTYTYNIPEYPENISRVICQDELFQFGNNTLSKSGIYTHTFKTSDNCDSLVTLELEVLPDLEGTTHAKIFEGETFELENYRFKDKGQHEATIKSTTGCDSLVTVDLDYYHVYFPNIFSPNNDGQNDRFSAYGGEDLMEIKRLTIFDRWGKQIYDDTNILDADNEEYGWSGTHNGKKVATGVYAYIVTVLMDDGKERQFKGTVLAMY